MEEMGNVLKMHTKRLNWKEHIRQLLIIIITNITAKAGGKKCKQSEHCVCVNTPQQARYDHYISTWVCMRDGKRQQQICASNDCLNLPSILRMLTTSAACSWQLFLRYASRDFRLRWKISTMIELKMALTTNDFFLGNTNSESLSLPPSPSSPHPSFTSILSDSKNPSTITTTTKFVCARDRI